MSEYYPRNVLVTGGAGFIGAHFVQHLLKGDPSVSIVNLDLMTYAADAANLNPVRDSSRHRLVKGDICDRALVDRLIREHRIDTVVHFAAESHVDRSIDAPAAFVTTNIIGTHVLLEAVRDAWYQQGSQQFPADRYRFHHISTDEVYGSLEMHAPSFTETHRYEPNSPYSASKAAADHLVRAYHHTYGIPATITNCSNNYGPFQHAEKFIPTIIRKCLTGEAIPVYGDGSNIRDWLYVSDHCSGIEAVLRRGTIGRVYNIGGGHECSNLEVARTICGLLDEIRPRETPSAALISFVTDRPGHDWRYAIDTSRIRSELGWEPQESFESGIRKTIRWYVDRHLRNETASDGSAYA